MDRTLKISRAALAVIQHEARQSAQEICGLLLAGDPVRAQPCRNVHPHPGRHFEIDPAALLGAHRAARAGGPAIVGHYHSHPSGDASPSRTDAAQAAADGAIWLIVAGDAACAWLAVCDGAIHGRFDPLPIALV